MYPESIKTSETQQLENFKTQLKVGKRYEQKFHQKLANILANKHVRDFHHHCHWETEILNHNEIPVYTY